MKDLASGALKISNYSTQLRLVDLLDLLHPVVGGFTQPLVALVRGVQARDVVPVGFLHGVVALVSVLEVRLDIAASVLPRHPLGVGDVSFDRRPVAVALDL